MLHIFCWCQCICDILARRAKGEQCLTSGKTTVNCYCTFDFIDTKGRKWGKTEKKVEIIGDGKGTMQLEYIVR